MQWIEITIDSTHEDIDGLCDKLEELGVSGLIIEDETDVFDFLEENRAHWDYIDEELEESVRGVCRVKFYVENSEAGLMELENIRAGLNGAELVRRAVSDEDWENNWKQYYKPIKVGERLLIVPEWEDVPDTEGRVTLRLDPGLIFGTGSHPTTQMCLEALERRAPSGGKLLDLGCGSGILSIAGLLLGADSATGIDIDDKAPKTAYENAALNGIDCTGADFFAGDVLGDGELESRLSENRYDIITANIVADVIIALAPKVRKFLKDDGTFICSGIIEGRQDEVRAALDTCGFEITEEYEKEGWHAFSCRIGIEEGRSDMELKAVVLAAGKGTRLRTEGSDLPKVMRKALDKPLLQYVLDALDFVGKENVIIVVGYKKEDVIAAYGGYEFAVQYEQLGTGHAVMAAEENLRGFDGAVLVCCGDMPLIKRETYKALAEVFESENSDCAVLSGVMDEPGSYGRIVRDENGGFLNITEAKDCTEEQLRINEVNSGLYIFSAGRLFEALKKIGNDNAQAEYYLTDVPEIILRSGGKVSICRRDLGNELIGVNTMEQLNQVEGILREERRS